MIVERLKGIYLGDLGGNVMNEAKKGGLLVFLELLKDTFDVVKCYYDDKDLPPQGLSAKIERDGYQLEVTLKKL